MASIFDNQKYGGHTVAESTQLLGTNNALHFYNIVADTNLDNGSAVVIKPENYVEDDYFKAAIPNAKDEIALLLNPVKIYQEYTKKDQEEANYFLGKGEIGRAYQLGKSDRFAISDEGFANDAVPAAKKYVVVTGTDNKFTTLDSEPTKGTYGFVGYILKKSKNNKWVIYIKRNTQID